MSNRDLVAASELPPALATAPPSRMSMMPDGIYFNMPDTTYHKAFALSSHGIKLMRQSSLDFWARTSLNPLKPDDNTVARAVGRGYHKRTLEGLKAFQETFAPEIDRADHPGAIETIDEIRGELAKLGLTDPKTTNAALAEAGIEKVMSKCGKGDWIKLLKYMSPDVVIWDDVVAQHVEIHKGREFLPADAMRQIHLAARMIEMDPDLCDCFRDGYPEVSIFWTDYEEGIPMKSRLDYLKLLAITDLKSFENSQGIPLARATHLEVARYKHHIQGRMNLDAARVAQDLIRAGHVFGADDDAMAFCREFAEQNPAERQFMLLFQQKGPAPVAIGHIIAPFTLTLAESEIRMAARRFRECMETYGEEPWLDPRGVIAPDHTEYPVYIAE